MWAIDSLTLNMIYGHSGHGETRSAEVASVEGDHG
jgi:hypothetical protein